jgi:CheY-like chemotaxis protein
MDSATRILIVEDDPDTAFLTSLVLETEGFTTTTLPSGEEALGFLRSNAKDVRLVLLDISLKGGLDGFQVCRQLRGDNRTRALPVIFFSANSTPENRQQALEAGGQGFLAKPFGYEQLLKEVDRALGPN